MLLKACPRCKRLVSHGLSYCSTCAPLAEAERLAAREHKAELKRKRYNREYNSKRDKTQLAFYRSKEWKATSRAKLSEAKYKCEAKKDGCTKLAVEVHHIKPIQTEEGWAERLEWSNLQAVCTSCHNVIHNRFASGKKTDDFVVDLRLIAQKSKGK